MKTIIASLFVILFFSCAKPQNLTNQYMYDCIRQDTTLLDLFYGMDDVDQPSTCVLDSLPGLLKLDCRSNWKTADEIEDVIESLRYEASLCVYCDSLFPTEQVLRTVAVKLDRMFQNDFVTYLKYHEQFNCSDQLDNLLNFGNVNNGNELIDYFHAWFEQIDEEKKLNCDSVDHIPDLRVCLVACRIYEDSQLITYLFESSVDYHGSNGCPSSADYLTIEKKSGRVLTFDDFFSKDHENEIDKLLRQSYILEQQKKGYDDYIAIDVLLDHSYKNNCAKVKEGMLFYYHPYEIGCGADGQYNLIINPKTK